METPVINRTLKEMQLGQHSLVVWFSGLPCSGKTTLAMALADNLAKEGFFVHVLDGNQIRSGLNKDLGFSIEDRFENIRRAAELCKILLENGIIVICAFISPTERIRQMAEEIAGKKNVFSIYVSTPLEICMSRDVSGLYARSVSGEIKDFTGISQTYEPPSAPDLEINTAVIPLQKNTETILSAIRPLIRMKSTVSNKNICIER